MPYKKKSMLMGLRRLRAIQIKGSTTEYDLVIPQRTDVNVAANLKIS